MAEKVYEPEIVQDTPFPSYQEEIPSVDQKTTGNIVAPSTTKEKAFPAKRIATELIGTALNTKSRKILGEFELTESGALQIGKYDNAVSGDIRITPSGIVARDLAGLTTFALDGTTGDAVFKGELRAGSAVSGEIVVLGGGYFNLDSGADIILSSIGGDHSQIIFTENDDQEINARIYYDHSTNFVEFASETDVVGYRFGNSGALIGSIEVSALDGLDLKCYTTGSAHNFRTQLTSNGLLISYDGSPKMKVDIDGNLYITGTITENWVP